MQLKASDAAIHTKMPGSSVTTFILSNEEINDIMKMINSLEGPGLLMKTVSKTNKTKAKEQKGGFLRSLLGTLGATLIWNLSIGKGAVAKSQGCEWLVTLLTRDNMPGRGTARADAGTIKAGEGRIRAVRIFNAVSFFDKF